MWESKMKKVKTFELSMNTSESIVEQSTILDYREQFATNKRWESSISDSFDELCWFDLWSACRANSRSDLLYQSLQVHLPHGE